MSTINKSIFYPASFLVNVRRGSLAFFSGVAALICQTRWVKQLSLVVGVDRYAVTTGLAAFFVGLAQGSFWFGRTSERVAGPALFFAGLEGAMARQFEGWRCTEGPLSTGSGRWRKSLT